MYEEYQQIYRTPRWDVVLNSFVGAVGTDMTAAQARLDALEAGTFTAGVIPGTALTDDSVPAAKLAATGAPVDGYVPVFHTGGLVTWEDVAGVVGGDTYQVKWDASDTPAYLGVKLIHQDKTIAISTSGSDTTGSWDSPFLTLAAALQYALGFGYVGQRTITFDLPSGTTTIVGSGLEVDVPAGVTFKILGDASNKSLYVLDYSGVTGAASTWPSISRVAALRNRGPGILRLEGMTPRGRNLADTVRPTLFAAIAEGAGIVEGHNITAICRYGFCARSGGQVRLTGSLDSPYESNLAMLLVAFDDGLVDLAITSGTLDGYAEYIFSQGGIVRVRDGCAFTFYTRHPAVTDPQTGFLFNLSHGGRILMDDNGVNITANTAGVYRASILGSLNYVSAGALNGVHSSYPLTVSKANGSVASIAGCTNIS